MTTTRKKGRAAPPKARPRAKRKGGHDASSPPLNEPVVLRLADIQPPERLDHPSLGAQEAVDPAGTARRILAAHQATMGNTTHAAHLLGITYQGLRRVMVRFKEPHVCADGLRRMILVDVGDGQARTLDEAVQQLRINGGLFLRQEEVRTLITVALGQGHRLADIARAVVVVPAATTEAQDETLDPSRLTRFRSKAASLSPDILDKIEEVVQAMLRSPAAPRQGRRANAS